VVDSICDSLDAGRGVFGKGSSHATRRIAVTAAMQKCPEHRRRFWHGKELMRERLPKAVM
jgi:hypothetical protein